MIKLIIFDVDGTLIDTEQAVVGSYQRIIFEEFGRYYSDKELSVAFGIPTAQAVERLGFHDVEKACGKYYQCLFEAFINVKPFAGVIELLEEVKKRGIASGVVTSRNREEVARDASFQKLMKYFDCVICADDTEKHKPEAEPVLKLMEVMKAELPGTLYLGDTYYDFMCAKNAGVEFALAGWGARNTENIKADYFLRVPAELLALLG